jgi:amino acid adenylation domain-containing protein
MKSPSIGILFLTVGRADERAYPFNPLAELEYVMASTEGVALYSRFLRGLATSPDRPAIRLPGRDITYREAHRLALRWAGSLLARVPGDRDGGPTAVPVVGVLAGKGPHAYVGILAGLYAGATVVPLNPTFPAARTLRMLELSGARVVLADEAGRAALEGLGAAGDAPAVLVPDADGSIDDDAAPLARPRPVAPGDAAYMLFTSGSTGRPKGVPITHANTACYFDLLDRRYDFTADDVFSQTFDLNFDCAMFDLFCAWGAGAAMVHLPPQAYVNLPAELTRLGVTVWFSTPSAIGAARRLGTLTPGTMPGLRWAFFAGEALRCRDAADWQAAAPGATVENLYGPTELTVTITGHRWDPAVSPGRGINGLAPIGTVHEGHEHLLVDEADRPTTPEGELWISGPQMTPGYLDPADDKGRFVRHDGRVWYRTGDRVRRLDDGELVYLGRLDAQVQVRGWRVELAEVDDAVQAQPGVDQAVTVVREADGDAELMVFYTGVPTAPRLLFRALREVLPDGMLPRRFQHLERFPLNSNRKIDRLALRRIAVEDDPVPARR